MHLSAPPRPQETLRLVPPVPGIFKRNEVVEALSAGKGKTPFHLPKKTNLLLAFLPLHLDPAQVPASPPLPVPP